MLVIFKLTEEALGGVNVNLVDDWNAECLLSSKNAKLTLRFTDTLLGLMADDPEKPTRLQFLGPGVPDVTFDIALPPSSDQSAWNTLLAAKFPSGFPVTVRFFQTVMNGSARVHLLKSLNLENIKRCFSKTRHCSFGQAASTELLRATLPFGIRKIALPPGEHAQHCPPTRRGRLGVAECHLNPIMNPNATFLLAFGWHPIGSVFFHVY